MTRNQCIILRADESGPGHAGQTERWQALTRAANRAFELCQMERAKALYEDALHEAETLLRQAETAGGPPQAAAFTVISHHNLAELALTAGQASEATACYQRAFDGLLALAGKKSAPGALRQACVTHLQAATVALATHLQRSGASTGAIAQEINRARDVVRGSRRQHC